MLDADSDVEGRSPGAVSFGRHSPFGEERTADPFSEGASGARDRGGELFTDPGPDSRRIDPGDGSPQTTGRKRGRPKGSTNAKSKLLTGDRLAAARRKLADTLSGVVGFGISVYGTARAKLYKPYSLELAERVYRCYQINPKDAHSIGEPLADTFVTWFPQYVETTTKAVDPGLALARLYLVLQQCNENEKSVAQQYQQRFTGPKEAPTNGMSSEDATKTVEETINQWNQGAPSPEEILGQTQDLGPNRPSDYGEQQEVQSSPSV